ncbi:MAG: DMT family transporter [Synergistaceae bacterium]|jgi:drug/metabolite transporter (DMT)-like permease|nr:DMT family transporter [Synergistaceae bacterium]
MASAFWAQNKKKIYPFMILLMGVVGVSTGSIFARLAQAHPLVKSAYRLSLALIILWPAALLLHKDEFKKLGRRDLAVTMLSGVFLALHFATWMSSLDYTTVASSVMLVNTIPIWIALLNAALGKGFPSFSMWLCMLCATVGASIVGYGDLSFSGEALWGDALALAGGIAAAAYIICGGEVRAKLSLLPYTALCYGTAALIIWCAVLLMDLKVTGFGTETWLAFTGMAFLSQVIGHSSYNWALRYFSTGFVAIGLLGEPIGAAVLAYFLFDEYPSGFKLAGLVILLVSIVIAAKSEG